jgi:hypothetical protein
VEEDLGLEALYESNDPTNQRKSSRGNVDRSPAEQDGTTRRRWVPTSTSTSTPYHIPIKHNHDDPSLSLTHPDRTSRLPLSTYTDEYDQPYFRHHNQHEYDDDANDDNDDDEP